MLHRVSPGENRCGTEVQKIDSLHKVAGNPFCVQKKGFKQDRNCMFLVVFSRGLSYIQILTQVDRPGEFLNQNTKTARIYKNTLTKNGFS